MHSTHHAWQQLLTAINRADAFLRRWISLPVPWFFVMPLVVAGTYWFGLRSLAFTDGGWFRIPALPKVFFDQTMYLQVMAKDILHGFSILPSIMRPFVWLARITFPSVSLSEFYVIGIILSAIASVWLFAALVCRMSLSDPAHARMAAIAAFLMAHALLVLRPGGPSWYVPWFLIALMLVWLGEQAFDRKRFFVGAGAWILATLLSSAYPWYFASIVAIVGLLCVYRFLSARHVQPVLCAGLVAALMAVIFRDRIVDAVLSSYAVLLAYYGGVQFSHVTTISNTMLLMAGWIAIWLPSAVRSAKEQPMRAAAPIFFIAAWVGQIALWFQSVITGLSIVPDHFIYSVWILSALSWACWKRSEEPSRVLARLQTIISLCASLYVLSIIIRLCIGMFAWTTYPSLVIHIVSWTFLALATIPLRHEWMMRLALLLGIVSTVVGMMAVRASAIARADTDRTVDGVRTWIMQTQPAADIRWCTDALTADYLFSVTGQVMYPTFSEKHDPVSIEALQNRLVEISAFLHPRLAGDLYIKDDMILHDLDFPCRVFQPGIRLVNALPLSSATKQFLTGCDQSWADAERVRVIARMDARWQTPVPSASALCDRFVVRKRLQHAWRIPPAYPLLFEDAGAVVYGTR